jgi:hypothetical protein
MKSISIASIFALSVSAAPAYNNQHNSVDVDRKSSNIHVTTAILFTAARTFTTVPISIAVKEFTTVITSIISTTRE